MSNVVQEIVSRFWASYQSDEDVPGLAEPVQRAEDTQQHTVSAPLEPACLKWWSGLSVAVQLKWLANSSTPTIREAWREHRKRQKAVNFARNSIGLKGFKPSLETKAPVMRFINGEIEFSEAIEAVKEQARLH